MGSPTLHCLCSIRARNVRGNCADTPPPPAQAYRGSVRNELRHGQGTYQYDNKFFKYTGDWVDGKKHGHGVFFLGDGGTYEGSFVDGEMRGQGTRRWPDGSTYTGEFLDGERHGQGSLVRPNGERYEGGWAANQRHGRGELVLADGSVYVGEFAAHKFHGNGKLTQPGGAEYSGNWVMGERDGPATQVYANGDVFEGVFENGKRVGEGKLVASEGGLSYEGLWVDDEPVYAATKMEVSLDEYEVPEEPAAPKGKKKAKAKKPKKGAVEEGPKLHDGKPFAPVLAGSQLPGISVRVLAPARDAAEGEEEVKGAGDEEDGEAKGGDGKEGEEKAVEVEGEGEGDGEGGEPPSPPQPQPKFEPATTESGRVLRATLWFLPPLPEDAEEGTPAPEAQRVSFEVPAAGGAADAEAPEGKGAEDGDGASEGKGEGAGEGEEGAERTEVDEITIDVGSDAVAALDGLLLPATLQGGDYFVRFDDATPSLSIGKPVPPRDQPFLVYARPEE